MRQNRLNNLMVLHIHKELLDQLSLIDVADDFVKESDQRQTVFGEFDSLDLRRKTSSVKSVGIQVDIK